MRYGQPRTRLGLTRVPGHHPPIRTGDATARELSDRLQALSAWPVPTD